jgi:cathepsin B
LYRYSAVFPTPTCPSACSNGLDMEEEKIRVKSITSCPSFDCKCIAQELYHNGPVSSYAGDIYEEFYAYSDGIYRESADIAARGMNHGGHVIKAGGCV